MRVFVAMLVLGCACSPPSSQPTGVEAGGGAGSACSTSDDCVGTLCAWPIDGGCNARGTCVTEDLTCTIDGPLLCACDGNPVKLGCIYGQGNAPAPLPTMQTYSPANGCLPPDDAGDGAAD